MAAAVDAAAAARAGRNRLRLTDGVCRISKGMWQAPIAFEGAGRGAKRRARRLFELDSHVAHEEGVLGRRVEDRLLHAAAAGVAGVAVEAQ